MAIQVSGTQVIGNSRELTNIASIDSATATAIGNAGVGGVTLPPEPNWSSPSVTRTSSGTYSLPSSISDSDFVWFLLTGSGGSGMSPGFAAGQVGEGGGGGNVLLIVCQGSLLNSGKTYQYVHPAGVRGNTSAYPPAGINAEISNFLLSNDPQTLRASGGAGGGQSGNNGNRGSWTTQTHDGTSYTGLFFVGANAQVTTNFTQTLNASIISGTNNFFPGGGLSIGGGGGNESASVYGGTGGNAPAGNGTAPGGGSGGASSGNSLPGTSGAGSMRIWY